MGRDHRKEDFVSHIVMQGQMSAFCNKDVEGQKRAILARISIGVAMPVF